MGGFGFQTHDAWQWLFVLAAFGLLPVRLRAARRSSLAPWAAIGVHVTLWALAVAFIGFMWDVAWHADTGRDKELFTVPHILILIGLFGIFAASLASIWTATKTAATAGWRLGKLRVPYSSLPLFCVGGAALLGFPLDDYWHAVYGIDVTMWSPTHLLMIGGASLAPLAIWLMEVEGGHKGSMTRPLAASVLIGLSTLQLEFDMGIPQWQLLFHPALIAAAASIGLVAARAVLGRGGALWTAVLFIVLRGLLAALIGPGLGHVLPRFPLYLVEALLVEAVFLVLGRRRPMVVGAVSGLLIGTVGLAAEWGWTHLWYAHPWPANLLNDIWIAVVIAIAGGVVGIAAGRVLARQPAGVPAGAVILALAVIGGLLAWHLPLRSAPNATAEIRTQTVGQAAFLADGSGEIALHRNVALEVTIQPASAVAHPDWLTVVAWQGRSPVRVIDLTPLGGGRYRAASTIPVGGNWKSLVFFARGDDVAAVPVDMPADPAYGLPGVPAPADRTEQFVPASHWLMRETHGGIIWPALLATVVFALAVITWAVTLGVAYWRFSAKPDGEELTVPSGLAALGHLPGKRGGARTTPT
ncbi:MAG TPA: hypothetical protein VF137_07450 [Candidatus Dormibacteraeota bacterium]